MPRIDHVAFESDDPDAAAAFYERMLGARVVKAEGHPVMAYLENTGIALHAPDGPGRTRRCGTDDRGDHLPLGRRSQAPVSGDRAPKISLA